MLTLDKYDRFPVLCDALLESNWPQPYVQHLLTLLSADGRVHSFCQTFSFRKLFFPDLSEHQWIVTAVDRGTFSSTHPSTQNIPRTDPPVGDG